MIVHLILGPMRHGVTRHGAALAGPDRVELEHVGADAGMLAAVVHDGDAPLHVHLTDHLLGDDAAAISRGIDVLAAAQRPIHVTLHDIPLPDEGSARFERRREVYRRLVSLATSVQVCSEHERRALAGMTNHPLDTFTVVRLPIDLQPVTPKGGAQEGPLGVLGFIHPGKNPGLAVDVGAAVGRDVTLLGAIGPGHEDFAGDLVRRGRESGIQVTITGHLSEAEMDDAIAGVSVPLAPYRHVSASGSIGRWIAAGRRPVVVETPWARELAEHAPRAIRVVDVAGFEGAVREALADPTSTWWSTPPEGLLTTADAARLQHQALADVEGMA